MTNDLFQTIYQQLPALYFTMRVLTLIINIIFAGAVAKDAAEMTKIGQPPVLVSSITWAFATLIGGIFVALAYWFIHHSTLTRTNYQVREQ